MAVGEPRARLVRERLEHDGIFDRRVLEIAHADERGRLQIAMIGIVLDLEDLVDLVDRFLRLVLRHQYGGIAKARRDEIRREFDAALEEFLGPDHAALFERDLSEQLQHVDIFGVGPEMFEQGHARFVEAALAIGRHRVAQDRIGHRGEEIFRIRRVGALAAPHAHHLIAERVPSIGEPRIEVDGVFERLGGAAVVADHAQHETELVMDLRPVRLVLRQLFEDRAGRGRRSFPAQRDGEQKKSVGLVGILAQDVARARFRLRRIGTEQAPHFGKRGRYFCGRVRTHQKPFDNCGMPSD